jgi:hypothetical protein
MPGLNDFVVPDALSESYDPAKYVLTDGLTQDQVADGVVPSNYNEGLAALAQA